MMQLVGMQRCNDATGRDAKMQLLEMQLLGMQLKDAMMQRCNCG